MSDTPFSRAADFVLRNARLIERRLFTAHFGDGDPASVATAVSAYRNPDGGLGHALEPDIRCAESQPLFAEIGLGALVEAGARAETLAIGLCDFLSRVADRSGLVPPIVASALDSPRATHWTERALQPALNPTAGLCGLLHAMRVKHAWLDLATETCLRLVAAEAPSEAHTLLTLARLADHHPDPDARVSLRETIARALPGADFYIAEAPVTTYGLTPLHFAPTADSPWRELFTDSQLHGHLDDLAAGQQPDGGWPIRWEAPGAGATAEWRGRVTLEAVRTLVSYGVLQAV